MEEKTERCQFRKCNAESEVVYLGFGLCERHWVKICDMTIEKSHKILGIEIKKDENEQLTQNRD